MGGVGGVGLRWWAVVVLALVGIIVPKAVSCANLFTDLSINLARWDADERKGRGLNRVGGADRSATLPRGLLIGVILHELRTHNCRAWTSSLNISRRTSSMAPGMGGSSSSERK